MRGLGHRPRPGGGESGGRVVAQGTPQEIANNRKSITGHYLKTLLVQTVQMSGPLPGPSRTNS